MAKIPQPTQHLSAMIDKYHQDNQEAPRPHLGCSTLGHHCERWLWLSFRWSVIEPFAGRILRLFRRGHMEEDTIIKDLRNVGVDIRDMDKGEQFRVDFGSHVSGSVDGVIFSGVPSAEGVKHIAEFKTHSKKSFDDLKKGVKASKPMHYAQMQVYMLGMNINRALYVAVCKDDDRLHTERVRLDKPFAEALVAKGKRIALSDRMPEPCSGAAPDWYLCKWCPAFSMCHKGEPTKQGNCRTCAHSTAMEDSTWRCERHNADNIPLDYQRQGCDSHVPHPDLVPYKRKEADSEWETVYIINGKDVLCSESGYTGKEIIANPEMCASGDMDELRKAFSGRLIE
tara:strand:+ start:1080 stop:2099 length:1020 start_codon:yes stop_codon:yes gene_type:complete